jgi:hypothetical protein
MSEDIPPSTVPELPSGRFSGRDAFQQLVRDALACAAREGWRHIILADSDFADWPLGERAVIESLQAWAKGGRRCTLLARRYDEVLRRHARFVTWRGTWSHIIDARRCAAADAQELPSAIWSPGWVLQRLHRGRARAPAGPARAVAGMAATEFAVVCSQHSGALSRRVLGHSLKGLRELSSLRHIISC